MSIISSVAALWAGGVAEASDECIEEAFDYVRGDGWWSIVRDDSVVVGDTVVRNSVTYEFLGQVEYPTDYSGPDSGPFWVDAVAEHVDVSIAGQIIGATWFDRVGGKWVAVEVDETVVETVVAEADALFSDHGGSESVGSAEEGGTGSDDITWVEHDGYWMTPYSWSTFYCGGSLECQRWEDDDREQQTTLSERQKAVAMIRRNDGGGEYHICSGVWISPYSLLTAAHCVWPIGHGSVVSWDRLQVCTRGNVYSDAACNAFGDIEDVDVSSSWDGGSADARHDIAVVTVSVDVDLLSSHTNMALSSASDGYVTDFDMHTASNPFYRPEPSAACYPNYGTPVDPYHSTEAYWLTHMMGSIWAPLTRGYFRFDMDYCQGQSGSPVFYCGDEWCDTGEVGFVVSLLSGFCDIRGTAFDAFYGPKVHQYRTWILSNL